MHKLHAIRSGSGPLALFIHGIGSSATAWSQQFERLSGEYTCIAPDLPGYGESPVPAEATLDTFVDNVAAVIQMRRAHVVGVSFGALVALGLARRHAGLVRSLALADATLGRASMAGTERESWLANRRRLAGNLAGMSLERARQIAGPGASAEVLDEIAAHMRRARPEGYLAATEIIAGADARPWLSTIDVPTLVLCGEHDTVTGAQVSASLANGIKQASVCTISGAGHAPHIEVPDEFARALRAFLTPLHD